MNRIAGRAAALWVPVLVLILGLGLFLAEYFTNGEQWVLFSGSPHVYEEGKVATGVITDREGILLADLSDQRRYCEDAALRRATLHWVGDREGNIAVAYPGSYTQALTAYDPVNGLYRYGDSQPRLELTLDARVQTLALEAMGDRVGTLAVYNYRTGELLCAVTTPTFDPEAPPELSPENQQAYEGVYMNRFLQSAYIPGSVFKILTLGAALELLPQVQQETFSCSGSLQLEGGRVTCMRPHGEQTLAEAFTNSCNCAFARLALELGSRELEAWVTGTGALERVSFDGFLSARGNLSLEGAGEPELAWSGIGQYKDQINPCGFLTFLGAVAGGGRGAAPYVVERVSQADRQIYGAQRTESAATISPDIAALLQEYMARNVTEKYGAEHFPGMTVCAKSGTGEVGGGKAPNALFAGFVAQEDCPLAFLVVIQEGGFGADTCIPILAPVLEAAREAVQRPND